jgi:hypothetical protein
VTADFRLLDFLGTMGGITDMSGVVDCEGSWATVSPTVFRCVTSSRNIDLPAAKGVELFFSTAVAGSGSSVKEVSCSSRSFSASLKVGLES